MLSSNNLICLVESAQGHLWVVNNETGKPETYFSILGGNRSVWFPARQPRLYCQPPGPNMPLEISAVLLATVLLCVTAKCWKCIDGSGLMDKLSSKTSVPEWRALPEGISSLNSPPLCFCSLHPTLFSWFLLLTSGHASKMSFLLWEVIKKMSRRLYSGPAIFSRSPISRRNCCHFYRRSPSFKQFTLNLRWIS